MKDGFTDWLVTNKEMNIRSAKDVKSRCNRVKKITKRESITINSISFLENSPEFLECSIYIKSQLKRAISLYLEYLESGVKKRENI